MHTVNAAFCVCLQVKLDLVMSRQQELEEELASLGAQQSTRSTARRRKVPHTRQSLGLNWIWVWVDKCALQQTESHQEHVYHFAAKRHMRNVAESSCCLFRKSHKSKRHWKSRRCISWRMPSSCCCTKSVKEPSAKLRATDTMA